jgi:plastocyanin
MRSTCCGLLLGLVTLGGLGLAPSQAEAQLLPWRRPRVVLYSSPPVYYAAPAVSYYYAPPAVSYYYAPPVTYLAPVPAVAAAYAYGPPLAPSASAYFYGPPPATSSSAAYGYANALAPPASSGSYTSSSAYYQPEAGGPTMNVSVHDNDFQPATINVFAGTTVSWRNDSTTAHTVTSDTGLFDSREIPAGRVFRYTFNQPGTYLYHCAIHPQMRGTIVVQ